MKKHVLLAMAVIMVLGSIKAMAMSEQEAMDMNQQSKVEAGIRNQQWESLVDQDTKIQGAHKAEIRDIRILSYQVGTALGEENLQNALRNNSIAQIDFEAEQNFKESDVSENGQHIEALLQSSRGLEKTLKEITNKYNLKLRPLTAQELRDLFN